MVDPQPGERIGDPAAGTCGFLVNAWQHILETHTDPKDLTYDEDGWPHGLTGSRLSQEQWRFQQAEGFTGYDNDSGMTMLRLGSMNMMLHGLSSPRFRYADTLSKSFSEEREYDVILANPPFKGAVDSSDVSETLPAKVRKTELLFLYLFLRLLEQGGRAAVIVPTGVLYGMHTAHVAIRKRLVDENRLDGVVSMPSGVFRPYTGVSTAVLLFTRGAATERVWFYDMEHDGFSLDDKRQRVRENDIPDLMASWVERFNAEFQARRESRLAEVQEVVAPLGVERVRLEAELHRLRFDEVLAADQDQARQRRKDAERGLEALDAQIAPFAREINQLTRQFWVDKELIVANEYDLSASRYRTLKREDESFEEPAVTLDRLAELDAATRRQLSELREAVEAFRARLDDRLRGESALTLGDVVDITGGGTPSRARSEFFEGTIPWLTSKDMRGDYIWDTEEHITQEAVDSSATKLVPVGSILVVVKSKVLMHRLPVAMSCVSLCHGQDVKSLQCHEGFDPEFVRFLLAYHEQRLLNSARGANTEGLTLPMLQELPVPDVTREEQAEFASLVARYERFRDVYREADRQSDHLFRALLSETFAAS